MSEHEWLESAAPYALGALDADERAAFEAHLAACDVCGSEVREMREVAGLLALGGPPVAPPAGLRERVVAGARAVRPISAASARPGPALDATAARSAAADAGPRAEGPVGGAPMPRAESRARTVIPWLAAAAAVVFALVLGQRYQREHAARVSAERSLAAVRATLDSSGALLASRDSLIATLVAPDVQAVSVTGSGPSPSARYYLDRRRGRVVLAAFSLPPAAAGRTYQVWGIETGRPPVSLGTFDTDSSGRAIASLDIPAGLRIAVTAVTDEPAGGSPQPTTTPFLAATWKAE